MTITALAEHAGQPNGRSSWKQEFLSFCEVELLQKNRGEEKLDKFRGVIIIF